MGYKIIVCNGLYKLEFEQTSYLTMTAIKLHIEHIEKIKSSLNENQN